MLLAEHRADEYLHNHGYYFLTYVQLLLIWLFHTVNINKYLLRATMAQKGFIAMNRTTNKESKIKCVLCGKDIEETPGGWKWGNNPWPLADENESCCECAHEGQS